jgi:diadenosine tetraphosphate (Ap4A) HIT family hydrolase
MGILSRIHNALDTMQQDVLHLHLHLHPRLYLCLGWTQLIYFSTVSTFPDNVEMNGCRIMTS